MASAPRSGLYSSPTRNGRCEKTVPGSVREIPSTRMSEIVKALTLPAKRLRAASDAAIRVRCGRCKTELSFCSRFGARSTSGQSARASDAKLTEKTHANHAADPNKNGQPARSAFQKKNDAHGPPKTGRQKIGLRLPNLKALRRPLKRPPNVKIQLSIWG